MPGMSGHTATTGVISPFWLALLLLVPATAAYALGVLRLTRRGDRWPVSRSATAEAAFVVLTAALMPPLVASVDFPVHVSQHLMLAMLAPLALALSAPVALALRRAAPHRPAAAAEGPAQPPRWGAELRTAHPDPRRRRHVRLLLEPAVRGQPCRPWLHVAMHTHMFLAGCLLSWYLVGRDPMPHRPPTRTALIVLIIAAGSHDLLSKLMYAHLLPHGGGTPVQIRVGAQIMFYGGDAIDITLASRSCWPGTRVPDANSPTTAAEQQRPPAPPESRGVDVELDPATSTASRPAAMMVGADRVGE